MWEKLSKEVFPTQIAQNSLAYNTKLKVFNPSKTTQKSYRKSMISAPGHSFLLNLNVASL